MSNVYDHYYYFTLFWDSHHSKACENIESEDDVYMSKCMHRHHIVEINVRIFFPDGLGSMRSIHNIVSV